MGRFMYPRKIQIRRPPARSGVGFQPAYSGTTRAQEAVIASDIPASIQGRREGQRNPVGLPGDGTRPTYYVFIPKRALANGVLRNLDIVEDDLGARYQCVEPYWDSLGYRATVELLDP